MGGEEPVEWGAVLLFDTDDPEFTRGFEAGMIWQATECGRPWSGVIHGVNAEMVLRIAAARGLGVTGVITAEEWMEIEIGVSDSRAD